MKRIIFPFTGRTVGGSHISALLLAQGLQRKGWDVQVVCHAEGPVCDLAREKGLPAVVPDYFTHEGRTYAPPVIRSLRGALKYLAGSRPCLLHTHDGFAHVVWGGAAKILRIPHIWHQRTSIAARRSKTVTRFLGDYFIANSEFVKSTLSEHARKKLSVVYNPLDFEPWDALYRRRMACASVHSGDTYKIGFFANLVPQKRPEMTVELARRLTERKGMPAEVFMYGDDRFGFWQRESASAPANLRYCGFTPEPIAEMAKMDLLFLPAVDEAFGRVIIEAAAAGVPVVASRSGGHAELIAHGKNGLLFSPDSAEEAVDAVERMLNDPPLAMRLASENHRRMRAITSLAQQVEQVEAIYARLIDGYRGTHAREL